MHILLIEDDDETADCIAAELREENHDVTRYADGAEALEATSRSTFDLLIVDRMLPRLDGLALVKKIRERGVAVPVLFLTTMAGIGDRVAGLNAGADDYLVKPFAFAELVARVSALTRRALLSAAPVRYKIADLELDVVERVVSRGGRPVSLQPREFQLLQYLMRHAGQVVTRTMLLSDVWRYDFDPRTNIVESHLSRLRAKVDKGFSRELIETVRGIGYRLRA